MSKIVIPSDWDNEEWDSFCIKWPKSIQYRGVLLGLIYSMTRGRAYDETTGSVRDAQEIGKRIFDANYPLSTCGATGNSGNGAANGPDYSHICNFGWCDSDEEDCEADDMSNCCLSSQIRIENGKLQVLDCGKWVDVGNVGTATDQSTDDTSAIEPGEGQTETDFACAKATAYVELLWATMYAGWDHWRDAPWAIIKNIQTAAGVDLNNNYVGLMVVAILDADATETDLHDIVENTPKQEAICRLAVKLDGSTAAMTDSDRERVIGMREWLSTDALEWAYIDVCNDAIGRGNYDRAGRAACTDPTFDCSCPTVTPPDEEIPIAHTWSKVFDFKLGAYGFTGDSALNTLEYQAGVGWVCTGLDGGAMNVPIMGRAGAVDDPFPCNLLYYKIHVAQWPINLSVAGGTPMTLKVGGDWKGSAAVQRGSEYITMILPGEAFNLATRIEWGWNEYFNGSGNENVQTVIDKLVIAGNGGDFWSMINPDGTVG